MHRYPHTDAELADLASDAGESIVAGTGVLIGAVHDCDVLGVANAVVRAGGSTDGVIYFDAFNPAPELTFTGASAAASSSSPARWAPARPPFFGA